MAQRKPAQSSPNESLNMPHSRETEMALLSCLMNHPDSWAAIVGRATIDDFYFYENQKVFGVLADRLNNADSVDIVSLAHHLRAQGELSRIGDMKYLGELKTYGAAHEAIKDYLKIVRETSQKRQLLLTGHSLIQDISNGKKPLSDITGAMLSQVDAITAAQNEDDDSPVFIKTSIARVMEKINHVVENGEGGMPGLRTGFEGFDAITLGLQPADIIIVAGRPSMGKTTFAMNIAENAAMDGSTVMVFSLEMPADALTMRMVSSIGRIDSHHLKTGRLDQDEAQRLPDAISVIEDLNIIIDDKADMTVTEFKTRARKAHKEHKLDLIVIDYLQLMRATGPMIKQRSDEISEISRSIKQVAKELGIPIIALSQLNRALEQRQNKRPVNSDLRESGSIEQDADLIVFLYRDEIYHDDSPEKGIGEVIIGKHRNGSLGIVKVVFEGQYSRFHNIAARADNIITQYDLDNSVGHDGEEEEIDPDEFDVTAIAQEAQEVSSADMAEEDGLAAPPSDPRLASRKSAMRSPYQ